MTNRQAHIPPVTIITGKFVTREPNSQPLFMVYERVLMAKLYANDYEPNKGVVSLEIGHYGILKRLYIHSIDIRTNSVIFTLGYDRRRKVVTLQTFAKDYLAKCSNVSYWLNVN